MFPIKRKTRVVCIAACMAVAGAIAPPKADAAVLAANGEWNLFRFFSDTLPHALPQDSITDPYTFTVPAGFSGKVDVTDWELMEDRYQILDTTGAGVNSLGITGPAFPHTTSTDNKDLAFADSRWSSGSFLVGTGDHSLTFRLIEVNQTVNHVGGNVRLTLEAIPEAHTSLLAMFGVTLLGFRRRRNG